MGISGTAGFPGGPGMKVHLIHGYCNNHILQIVLSSNFLIRYCSFYLERIYSKNKK